MKELYIEGVAIRGGPESCVGVREGVGEALTGVRAGWAIEPRKQCFRGADAVRTVRKATSLVALSRGASGPCAVREPVHVRNLHAREPGDPTITRHRCGGGSREEGLGRKLLMDGRGKSDDLVVPAKPSNNAAVVVAEMVEGRGSAEGNVVSETQPGLRAGLRASHELDRVRQVARKDKDAQFTALLHHVSVDRLRAAYRAISSSAAAGVDGMTWKDYGQDLEGNLVDLYGRVHRGAYRARPSRRVYIPKSDGRLRPLGVAALEDKIVQRAVVEVMNAIYEPDFLGFSYGFRPGRGPHDALDALTVGISRRR